MRRIYCEECNFKGEAVEVEGEPACPICGESANEELSKKEFDELTI
jgi:hypothetical protein